MSDSLTIYRLLKKDPRYPIEAYQFVREGLSYATEVLRLGQRRRHQSPETPLPTGHADLEQSGSEFQAQIEQLAQSPESPPASGAAHDPSDLDLLGQTSVVPASAETLSQAEEHEEASDQGAGSADSESSVDDSTEGRHLTGQELCEALRLYALHQYGYLAKSVLEQWGIAATSDFGALVYNMIEIGLMRKSDEDRREHFDAVYDFQAVFVDEFQFQVAGKGRSRD
jgi:uncharacterized repeat protein (TIGR04138 family)